MVWGISRILEELVYERFDISDKCHVIHISFIIHVLEIQRFMMGFRSVNLIPFEGRTSQVGHRNDLLFSTRVPDGQKEVTTLRWAGS
jgi:hypothetical protein